MPICYFFKDGQIIKQYPSWQDYCNDVDYIPEKGTYHWEVGDIKALTYKTFDEDIDWVDIDHCPPEIKTLILLLG